MGIIARMTSFVQNIEISQVPEVGELQLVQRFDQFFIESQIPKIPLWVTIQASYACISPPPSSLHSALHSAETSPRDPAQKGRDPAQKGRGRRMLAELRSPSSLLRAASRSF
jgi:hypothetical protein